MLGQHTEVVYEVPGQDIIDKLIERAYAAEKAMTELAGENGKAPDSACERGLFEMARRDVEVFRLRAKYLDKSTSYTVTAGTLKDIFIVVERTGTGESEESSELKPNTLFAGT